MSEQEAKAWAAEFGIKCHAIDDLFCLEDKHGNGECVSVNCTDEEFRKALTETIDGEAEGDYWRSPRGRQDETEEAYMRGEAYA